MTDRFAVKLYPKEGEALVEALGQKYRITIADFESIGIVDGEEVGDDGVELLCEAAEKLSCIKKAFVYLSYKAHPKRALGQKLRRAGFSETATEKALVLLEKKGYLDDAALCEEYAVALQRSKGYGILRIKKELYAKGFERDTIEIAVEALEDTPEEVILEVLRKKFPHLQPEDRQGRAKAVAYLSARGYGYDEINNAISVFKGE